MRIPAPTPVPTLGPGEVGYLIAGIKDVGEARSGETVTEAARPAPAPRRATASPKPMVFCGLYPDRRRRVRRRSASRSRSCGSTTASFTYDAGDLRRPRLRLPLRLPRPAAHGDRARAPRARVRPQPHRHRAVGRVPRAHHRRRGASRCRQPVARCPTPPRSTSSRSRCSTVTILTPSDLHGHADGAVPAAARRHEEDGVPVARAARARLPHPARRGRASTSSTS